MKNNTDKTVRIKVAPDIAEESPDLVGGILKKLQQVVPHIMDRTRTETRSEIVILLESRDAKKVEKALETMGGMWVSVDEGNTLPAGETIINPRPSSQPKSGYEGWEQKPDWRGDEHPEQRPDNEDFGGEGLEAA